MEYVDNISRSNRTVVYIIEVLKAHVSACCSPGVHPDPSEIHFNVLYS